MIVSRTVNRPTQFSRKVRWALSTGFDRHIKFGTLVGIGVVALANLKPLSGLRMNSIWASRAQRVGDERVQRFMRFHAYVLVVKRKLFTLSFVHIQPALVPYLVR